MNTSEFRPDINALRALAVLSVIAYHFGIPGFTGGFIGVDVFFVISGFLISSQILDHLSRGSFSFASFYVSRLRRIFPALFFVVLACLVLGWFSDLPRDYINANRHAVSALLFVSNIAFAGEQGYFDAAAHTKSLLHTWSLSVEGQFYIFLPLFLLAVHRIARRWVVGIVALAMLVSFGWTVYLQWTSPGGGFYLLGTRSWEFLAGTCLAGLRLRQFGAMTRNILAPLGLSLLLVGVFWIDSTQHGWPGALTFVPVAGTACLILAKDAVFLRRIFSMSWVQRTGDISYSLYLWHWPVFVAFRQWSAGTGRPLGGGDILVMALISWGLAWLSWKFIEQPVRSQRGYWTNRRICIGALGGVLLTLGFGLAVLVLNGVPARQPEYVQRAANAVFLNTPRDECFRRGDSTKDASEQFCVFGDPGVDTPTMMLWGDSHANQYLSAVSMAAHSINRSGFIATQSGCSAALVVDGVNLPSKCAQFNIEVWDFLQRNPSVKTVILGKWWGDSLEAVGPTARLAEALGAMGRTVVIVGALPYPRFNVPERWARMQLKQGGPINRLAMPRETQIPAVSINRALAMRFPSSVAGQKVLLLNPMDRLCDDQECLLVSDGVSNFRDESHISESADLAFAQDFQALLARLR